MAYSFGTPYHFVSHRGTGRCLNVYGNEQVSQNRNVCLWEWSNGNAQSWVIRLEGAGGRIYTNLANTTYGLNAYRSGTNWNCDIHTVQDNQTDSLIDLLTVDAANNLYRITLINYPGRYLTAEGTGDGANVSWATATGGDNQVWKITQTNPGSSGGGGGNQPGAIAHDGHIVSHGGAGGCLNVYGNETISSNRNVCVWSWSNSNAQTWKVAAYAGQRKIFSSLEYPTYALNIYRDGTNNCDVYPHAGNDADSLIYTTAVAGKAGTNYIRLASGAGAGLALTADGTADGSNVRWAAYTGAINQQWLFTATEPVTPPTPGIGDTFFNGHLVSYAGEGYCLNIYGNEQISPNRNVNVWEWSDSNAQTWNVAQLGSAHKAFSRLEHPTYALNIYRDGTNNCDVFPHVGNDADSLIYTSAVAGKAGTYFVRLSSGNGAGMALTADGQYNGANVHWAAYTGASNQQWLFTNTQTGPVVPPPTQGTADSSLVSVYMQAHINNYTPNRAAQDGAIQKITVHHCAGIMSVQSLGNLWQNPTREGSSHYGVRDNMVGQYVMEKDVAWTDGYWDSNKFSVTIETSNSAVGGVWPVSDASFATLALLVADIAWRNNLGELEVGQNLTWHSMYAATECPGPYLLSRMGELAQRANVINANKTQRNGIDDLLCPIDRTLPNTTYDDDFQSPTRPNHRGVDMGCPQGTDVRAASYGEVIYKYVYGTNPTSSLDEVGNALYIKHFNADGSVAGMTAYEHLQRLNGVDQFLVDVGDIVNEGDVIAKSGHTGNSNVPHLHFEVKEGSLFDASSHYNVYWSGEWVDPTEHINPNK